MLTKNSNFVLGRWQAKEAPELLQDIARFYGVPTPCYYASRVHVGEGDIVRESSSLKPEAIVIGQEPFRTRTGKGHLLNPTNSKLFALCYLVTTVLEDGASLGPITELVGRPATAIARRSHLDKIAGTMYHDLRPHIKRHSLEWRDNIRPYVNPQQVKGAIQEYFFELYERLELE